MNINETKYYQFPNKIIMKKFTLMILIVGLVGVCSGVASGQTLQDGLDAYDKKNYKKALEILIPLAEQGDAQAQFKLGTIYDYGRGVSPDYQQAYKWYKLSADKGNGFSIYGLAWLHRNGQRVKKKQNKSNDLFKKALKILRPLAEQGDAQAQVELGMSFFLGVGVPQDDNEAVKWLRLSAEQGHAEGQYQLSGMYSTGEVVPETDRKEAVKWLRLSAEQGHAAAQNHLGFMYGTGYGVPLDYKEAVKWHRLSAEQGNAFAQDNLGFMYSTGEGVPQDYKEAVKWYRLSAEQGYASAQNQLGFMYRKGYRVQRSFSTLYSLTLERLVRD
jgi:uncharacterized protein